MRNISLQCALETRIVELKRDGANEGLPWSAESERDFWRFIESRARLKEPRLVLMDNGNLRAIWENDAHERVAVEFRGGNGVYFVFVARTDGPAMAYLFGEESVSNIGEKIKANGLDGLLE